MSRSGASFLPVSLVIAAMQDILGTSISSRSHRLSLMVHRLPETTRVYVYSDPNSFLNLANSLPARNRYQIIKPIVQIGPEIFSPEFRWLVPLSLSIPNSLTQQFSTIFFLFHRALHLFTYTYTSYMPTLFAPFGR